MKVVCIDAATRSEHCPLIEGETYTADPEDKCPDKCCFMIKETGRKWNKDRFATCTDLDETAMVNEEWEEKYCVPINK